MLFTNTLTALTLLGAASARIVGIAAPSTIAPNSSFAITIITENYIQSVADVSAVFGLAQINYPGYVGTVIASLGLGPAQSNILTNITVNVTLPSSVAAGSGYTLTGAITSLYGVSGGVVTTLYTLPNITIASPATNANLVSNVNGVNLCAATSTTTTSTTSATTLTTSATSVISTAPGSTTTSVTSVISTAPGSTTTSVTSVISTAPVSTTSSTSSAASATNTALANFPYTIQGVNAGLNALIEEILHSNFAGARANYNSLAPYFDEFLNIASPGATCDYKYIGADFTLSEAISTVQTVQGTLNIVLQDVRNSNPTAAKAAACDAIALYFNSGLYEYIFQV